MTTEDDKKIIYTGPSPRGWHRLQQAAECLQKYAWKYESPAKEGEPDALKKSPALVKGSLIHLALAQHYAIMRARQTEGDDPNSWCSPHEAVELIAKLEDNTEYIDPVLQTFDAYARCYNGKIEEQSMKILAVEELFDSRIAGKYRLTGRADLIYEDLAGRVYVVDHKTTSRLTSKHKQYYGVSGQLIGYAHMAREVYGDRFAGMVLNLIQHGDSPKFERLTLPRSPFLEQNFEQTVVDLEESIERLQQEGRPHDQWPKAMNELTCFHRYGACEFMDQCRFGKDYKTAGNFTIGKFNN